jgi:CheY-like chemotaxis protein
MAEKRNVLIVDDSSDDVLILTRALSKCPVPPFVQAVYDGSQAIYYFEGKGPFADRKEFPIPDLIILDLKMTRVNGFEFLEWLGTHKEHRPLVIILSGSALRADKEKALQLGAREYHVKQPDQADTIEMLTGVCERLLS